ncbi:(3,5-dihydroxyphenyl)acetyl-CoA 1,2-dioxygenase DpgC [Umezawaea tangerina]|uniref:3,5-dihydroxyphenylacetyl-CoA monooxygenase n=1 Tax=Umezawaea tangerina TaxID=84725 RepID=A0A2T0T6K7_9PSEU|nr:(3,5-dihydroxyphenyl)acetyl-CoA 1,2-dioxygenase DpgC [Umezawaea tangerina]PRY41280.1 3,5-dihydroxyphenylacetyl-CoA monooxygenase [Umezawaea tangerina]
MTASGTTERWVRALPTVTGRFDPDAAALAAHLAHGEDLLAALPSKPDRSPRQHGLADVVHRSARRLRSSFLRAHATTVYDEVTERRTLSPRLPELARGAARRVPGLLPDPDQMAAELRHAQADKEGREIDQAIFFSELLRLPDVGAHVLESMRGPTPRALALLPEFRRVGELHLGSVHLVRLHGVAHVTIHNGHCLNAEDDRLVDDLETAVDLALLDDDVHVGTLRGGEVDHPRYAGRRVFSAGINLKDLHCGRITYIDFLLRRETGFIHKLLRGLAVEDDPSTWPHDAVEKPWAAGVDTFAIGGGMQLLLVFDRVVAGADAYFSLPAAREGIVPGAGNLRLGRLAGGRLARQVILGGRKLWAGEPDARLVCDEVVEPGDVGDALDRAAHDLDNPAVVANRAMLTLAEEPPDVFRAYLARFALVQAQRLYSPDVLAKVGRFAS